jgi:hypothetical protein
MSDKNFKVKNGIDANGTITVLQPNTSSVPLIIKANTLATGSNMLEMQRPDGTVRFAIGNDGALTVNSNINFNGGNMTMYPGNSGQTALIVNGQTNQSVSNLIVKGASSQTANLQEWQDSSGTNLARIDSRGNLFAASILSNVSNQMYGDVNGWIVVPAAANRSAMVFRGAASQTADLTQWQDSAGSTLGSISSSGDFISVGNHSVRFAYHQNVGGTGAYLDYAQVSNTASIIQRVTTAVGLIVRGAASQTADFFQVQTNSGSSVFSVNYYGLMNASQGSFGNAIATARLNVDTSSASTVGLLVRGAIGQSADLQVWQDYGPTTKASIDTYGNAGFGGTAANSAQGLLVKTNSNAAVKGIVVVGAASQNANLQEWQDSAGTVYASINPYGQLSIGLNPTIYGNARISLNTVATTVVGMVIRGVASQTADLQQWQNSNGTVLAKVDPNGSITAGTNLIVGNATMLYTGGNYYNSTLSVATQGAGYSGIVVRGQASQTADLQQWQDSNGNVKSKVFYDGQFYTAGLTTEASYSSTLYGGYGGIIAATGTTAAVNFAPFTADRVVEKIRGYTAQTADLTQWQNSAGTVLAKVGSDGALTVNNANINYRGDFVSPFNITATFALLAGKSSQSGTYNTFLTPWSQGAAAVIVQGATSQTANLQEWQDSSGVVLSFISSSGNFSAKGLSVSTSTNTTNAGTFYNSAGTPVFNVDTSLNAINIGGGLSGSANNFASTWGYDSGLNAGYMTFATGALGSDSLAIRRTNHVSSGDYTISTLGNMRLSTASGKNFNFNNGNIGIATTAIGTNNKIIVNPYSTIDNLATVQINTNAATNKGLVVQGYTSQSANLQEWQRSDGTYDLAFNNGSSSINKLVFTDGRPWGIYWGPEPLLNTSTGYLIVKSWAEDRPAFVVRARAGQSNALQIWQDSSGGTKSYVDQDGVIYASNGLITGTASAHIGTYRPNIKLNINNDAAGNNPLSIKGAASQTSDYLYIANSAGSFIASISSSGQFISAAKSLNLDSGNLSFGYGGGGIQGNLAIGTYALNSNTTGNVNLALGAYTLQNNTTGGYNVAIGTGSLYYNVSGTGNTAIGSVALQNNLTNDQTAIGIGSLFSATTGYANTGLGSSALNKVTTGTLNIAVGRQSGYKLTSGNANTVIGSYAMYNGETEVSTGSNNTVIGYESGAANLGSGNVFIGFQSAKNETGSNKLYIANSSTSTPLIGGDFSAGTLSLSANTFITAQSTSVAPLIVKYITGQSGNIQEWRNEANGVMSYINVYGSFFTSNNVGGSSGSFGPSIVGNPSGVVLTSQGMSGQTGDLQQWKNSNGTVLASINSDGSFALSRSQYTSASLGVWASVNADPSGGSSGTGLVIKTYNATSKGIGIFGSASQTADLQQWGNSAGTVLAYVNSEGSIYSANRIVAPGDFEGRGNSFLGSPSFNLATLNISTRATNQPGVVIRGVASQTADLQQWQNSSGTVLAAISSGGSVYGTGVYASYLMQVTAGAASQVAMIVKGASSQTANLQEWQNSAGSALANISPYGDFSGAGVFSSGSICGGTLTTLGGYHSYTSNVPSIPVVVNRAAASQSANIEEWQNSSGNVLASVSSAGLIRVNNTNTDAMITATGNSTYDAFRFRNAGGLFLWGGGSNNNIYYASTGTFALTGGNWVSGRLAVDTGATSSIGIVVRGQASQTADLQQWQNSAGSVLASINSAGDLTNSAVYTRYLRGGDETYVDAAALRVKAYSTSVATAVIKGAASQTADLQQWQNSAGTVLASISPTGKLTSLVDGNFNGVRIGLGNSNLVSNLAVGYNALNANTTGDSNLAIGSNALYSNTTGFNNVALGQNTLLAATTANSSVAVGRYALNSVTTGSYNTGVGSASLNNTTTGQANIAIGVGTMYSNVSGGSNVAIGNTALTSNTGSYLNVAIGDGAGYSATGAGNIFIGYNAGYNETGANKLYIANSNTSTPLIGGDFSVKTLSFAGNATITSQATGTVGLIVKAIASQTANLQEWQNSSGTVIANIYPNGTAGLYGLEVFTGGAGITGNYGNTDTLQVRINGAARRGILVKGAASQTANLQEWQDSAGTVLTKVDNLGNFTATSKSFDINHPTKENMRLRYGSLEGPENGVYIRGTAQSSIIELPEYWTGLVHEDSITVSLTSAGSAQNIYVEKIENNKIYIGGDLEKAFFTVYGERKDIDKLTVEY